MTAHPRLVKAKDAILFLSFIVFCIKKVLYILSE